MSFRKYISNMIQELQQKTADSLGNHVNKFSNRKQKLGFIVFTLTVGTFCFLLIIGTVGTQESARALKVDTISMPQNIHPLKWDSLKRVPAKLLDNLNSFLKTYKQRK